MAGGGDGLLLQEDRSRWRRSAERERVSHVFSLQCLIKDPYGCPIKTRHLGLNILAVFFCTTINRCENIFSFYGKIQFCELECDSIHTLRNIGSLFNL